jgi:hypothetical protein
MPFLRNGCFCLPLSALEQAQMWIVGITFGDPYCLEVDMSDAISKKWLFLFALISP